MPQPWEKYAAQPTSPARGDGPWNNYGNSTQSSAAPPTEHPGALERFGSAALNMTGLPSLYHAFTDPATPEEQSSGYEADQNMGGRGIHRLTSGLVSQGQKMAHDLKENAQNGDELKGMADLSSDLLGGAPKTMAKQVHEGDYGGAAGTGAGFVGMAAAPAVGEAALNRFGPAAMRAGAGAVNHAVEATPKMMKYGANPGRGMIEEGVTPNLSKFGMQKSLDEALPVAGQRVSDAVHGSTQTIPLTKIARSIEGPASEARGVIEGPGGGNRSSAPIDALQDSMTRKAPGASRPIYGAGAGTPFTPSEAVGAMAKPVLALPAPTEDIALPGERAVAGRPSQPVTLSSSRALPRDSPFYGSDTTTRLDPGMSYVPPESEFPPVQSFGNLGPNEYMGEIPGERGGIRPANGVLRRPAAFQGPEQASAFTDLRHPTATAPDVWETIRNVDRNTRFNPDPEVEGVNEVRRDMRGGLRNNLEEAVSDLHDVSQRYSDLRTADDALSRTAGRGSPLKSFKDMFAFPAETAGGHALYKFGKAASGAKASPFLWAPLAANKGSQ